MAAAMLIAPSARGDPGLEQLVPALGLAVIRRGLNGGGVQIGQQIAGRDDIDDVVLQDLAEPDAGREHVVLGRSDGPKGSQRITAVCREQGIVETSGMRQPEVWPCPRARDTWAAGASAVSGCRCAKEAASAAIRSGLRPGQELA
jgi:hypothetical protein